MGDFEIFEDNNENEKEKNLKNIKSGGIKLKKSTLNGPHGTMAYL
ncbi:hypothetical protein [Rothia aeria]|nr:hypothetical protein [Rothia aeria]